MRGVDDGLTFDLALGSALSQHGRTTRSIHCGQSPVSGQLGEGAHPARGIAADPPPVSRRSGFRFRMFTDSDHR